MLVLGLGKTTFNITKQFKKYKEYIVKDIVPSKIFNTPEEYEKNFNAKEFKSIKKYNKPNQEILVIVSGEEFLSVIKLLQLIQKAKITILFLKANLDRARKKNKLHQKVIFGVLQEYTRSGIFEEIILIDNSKISKILNNVSIVDFLEKSAEMIVSSFHMVNVLKSQMPVYGNIPEKEDYEGISTLGIVDLKSLKEENLFKINNVSSKYYLFCLNKNKIESDVTLLNKIDSEINTNIESTVIFYGVYSSDFENNYGYVITRTGNIQEI